MSEPGCRLLSQMMDYRALGDSSPNNKVQGVEAPDAMPMAPATIPNGSAIFKVIDNARDILVVLALLGQRKEQMEFLS
jgi:hypothetical protein